MSNFHFGNTLSGPGSVQANGDYDQQGHPETGTVQWNSIQNPSYQQAPPSAAQLTQQAEVLEAEATALEKRAAGLSGPASFFEIITCNASAQIYRSTVGRLRAQAALEKKKEEAAKQQTRIEDLGDLMDTEADDGHKDDSVVMRSGSDAGDHGLMKNRMDNEGNTRGEREVTANSELDIEMEQANMCPPQ